MAVSGHYSSLFQSFVYELLDFSFVWFLALVEILEFGQPLETFLISQTVEGSGQAIHGSRVREVRIGKSRSNEVAGVS